MKNLKRKSIVLLIAVAALLTLAIGGTVAYLIDVTPDVVNTFEPGKVETEIEEGFDNATKSSIVVKNKQDSIPVYVRVAVTGNWWKDEKIVESWQPNFTLGKNWIKGADGYYYYTKIVLAGAQTDNLLGSSITASTQDGKVLKVEVLSQSIQAEPTSAVQEAWGFVPGSGN